MFTCQFSPIYNNSYGPLLKSELRFCSICGGKIEAFDARILTRSRLGLLDSQIYNKFMALDLNQNFVSAQNVEYKLMDCNQILYMYCY